MPDAARLGTNPLRVTDPEMIPAGRYFEEEFYQLECDHLWTRAWQMACRLEQIPGVGDWVEYANVGKSIIVVRTKHGIRAYHNHCRHRGVPIAGGKGNGHGNCARSGFICPFHGWRWNMDGESTFVYGKHLFNPDLLDKQDLALKSCRVETWGGCAFINFDDNARSFRECIGPVADRLEARGVSNLRSEWWFATVLPFDRQDFPMIPRQDYSNIPIQQKGLHAQGFEFMRLARHVEGLIGNYHRLIDGYIEGAAPEALARANNLLGGNFDGPIAEMNL